MNMNKINYIHFTSNERYILRGGRTVNPLKSLWFINPVRYTTKPLYIHSIIWLNDFRPSGQKVDFEGKGRVGGDNFPGTISPTPLVREALRALGGGIEGARDRGQGIREQMDRQEPLLSYKDGYIK